MSSFDPTSSPASYVINGSQCAFGRWWQFRQRTIFCSVAQLKLAEGDVVLIDKKVDEPPHSAVQDHARL